MEHKDIYKFNPRIQDYKDVRREDLVERRKSKRKDCFDQRRNYSEDSDEKQENTQPSTAIAKGKENRRDLLKKWKEEHKKETAKNGRKPFVVGIVRHNAGSPLFRSVPPLRETRQTANPQATKPQASNSNAENPQKWGTSGAYLFGRQKAAVHKFKVASSVKKLTVPITPSFMDPTKRGNLASKPKPEASGVSKHKTNLTQKKPVPAAEKRVTRAAAKGAVKKSPMKKEVTRKVNKPLTSKATPSRKPKVAFADDRQTEECKTSEIRKIIENVVLTPAVRTTSEQQVQMDTVEDKSEAEAQAHEDMLTDTNAGATNTARPAQEFYDKLQRETVFLLECCNRWSAPAFTQTVPQDVSDEIDSTVGQARLLVSDKFQQFRNLIQNFEEGSQPPVTSEDLSGFWDMIYIQVDKMKERFDHLAELKSHNWAMKTVEVVKKRIAVKPKAVKPVVKSRFQEFMSKKRLGKNTPIDTPINDTPINDSPIEESQSKTDTPTGTPLKERMMQQILETSRSERRRSSLATASQVLRTSLIGKNLAMSPLLKTREKSAIETRKSIMRDNCPSSPLATFTGKARKKVEFGSEKSIECIDSPVLKRIPQTPKFAAGFNNLTDDDSDDETMTNTDVDNDATSTASRKRIPQTPRFVVRSNCMTDDESDSTLADNPRTPRFEDSSNCLTDEKSDVVNNSSCPDSSRKRSSRLSKNSHQQQTPDVSRSGRSTRSVNLDSTIQANVSDNVTVTGGNEKKVCFVTVKPICSPKENIDVNNITPVTSTSFESPKLRRSTRLRQNTPYTSRN